MRRSIALGLTILAAACHHAPASGVAPGCTASAGAAMDHADSIAALTGVFRVRIVTADSSYPDSEQVGMIWLTSGDTTHRKPPWLSRDTPARRTIIGAAAWGAWATAPRQIDPHEPALTYFEGSLFGGNYLVDIGSYSRFQLQSLYARSFSGRWHDVMSATVLVDRSGRVYEDPHGTFCATRVVERDSSSGRARLTVLVTDARDRRLTNVSVTAVELFTRAPAGELRWRGDDSPDSAIFNVAPGTYLLRADGDGARRETRIVRAAAGRTEAVHFTLIGSSWRPSDGPGMVDASGQTPEFAETIDGAAITAGLPSLRHAPLPAGTREIRLWAGFGNTEPSGMIELVQQGNAVSGLVLHWFSSPSEFDTLLPGNRDHAVRFVHRMNECNDIRQRDADSTDEHGVYHWVTCATARMGAPKLDRLWRAIDSLGVWSLPPESTLIQYGGLVHTDGTSLLVELRDGDQYRTYVYSDPQDQPSPQAAAADGILRLVLAATRFTLRPSADSAQ